MSLLYLVIFVALLIITGLVVYFLIFLKNFSERFKKADDEFKKVDEVVFRQIDSLRQELNARLKENRESLERSTQNVHRQITDFTTGITKMDAVLKQVNESVKEVSSFQQIFRAPKLRGRWGELALEHILSQCFAKDLYSLQYQFKSGEAVDAILRLPNGRLLPIDAKFPFDFFERMVETEDEAERLAAKKRLVIEVKKEIDDISRKYILPSEGTMDFALMYIPAEAVYYEILNNLREEDIFGYATKRKVVLVSPNTFNLTLQVLQQWARDLQIGKRTQEIIKKMNRVIMDAKKLDQSFVKLGKHLSDARSSYEDSEKRLGLFIERTGKLIELEGERKPELE